MLSGREEKPMTTVAMAWSTGKDAAYALHELRADPDIEVVAILTTVTVPFGRVSMHGVREQILDVQARELGLGCVKVRIPYPSSNEVYEERMRSALEDLRREGVQEVAFGDLFLEDVRRYRQENLARVGMGARFPLWGRDTSSLARQMMDAGISAVVTSVDPGKLDASEAGCRWDQDLLRRLPAGVDPCGENGEFHTLVTAGPVFRRALRVRVGPVVRRDGFVYADVLAE
jgi:uncharacterized protein (TIGR00290 family)